jgi:hypothetical protein
VATLIFEFGAAAPAEQNRLAESLRDALLDAAPGVQIERQRHDADAQDFGSTLVVILGTPAVVLLAKALRDWLTRTNAASVQVKTSHGTVIATNLESKDVPAITSALLAATRE